VREVGLGTSCQLALERLVVRLGAVVLQLPSDLGLLCLLTAAPHGVTPSTFGAGATSSGDVATPGIGHLSWDNRTPNEPLRANPQRGGSQAAVAARLTMWERSL